ncbi:MAG: serine hydroxymethyltransferase [Chloroflexi bacterium]|nr:serine hydroxymethyltransferase [Chloroflexota bacterium]
MTVAGATGLGWASLAEVDPELWAAMVGERERQRWKIELIASENYTFAAVMEAQGSWLTNKYAEGLPGKRYYGGCEYVDVVERLAQERALALFPGAEHVNVQPHAGAQANFAAYFAVLDAGDPVMGLNLSHGGHLTHGMGLNFSGRLYDVHAYGVDQATERFDYDAIERQAREVRPKLIVTGATAYPRIIDFERLAAIAHSVDALLFADMAHIAGLVAAGLHPSPFPHADIVTTTTHKTLRGPRGGLIFSRRDLPDGIDRSRFPQVKTTLAAAIDRAVFPGLQGGPLMHIVAAKAVALRLASTDQFRADQAQTIENARRLAETLAAEGARLITGGTDNHLMLVDVTPLGVTGREAERILDEIGVTVNKNTIPFDPNPPAVGSGIRIGTPAITTRGFGPDEVAEIGRMIVTALQTRDEPAEQARLAAEVREICSRFPVPGLPE